MSELAVTTGETEEPRFVTMRWLADRWKVSYDTVRRDVRKGALRSYRLPGGSIRIAYADAIAYGRPEE